MDTQKISNLKKCLERYQNSNIVHIELGDSLGHRYGIGNPKAIAVAMKALTEELKRQIKEEEHQGTTDGLITINDQFVFAISSCINGERFADMTPQRMCDVVTALGKSIGDISVTDDQGVVCRYEKESGNTIYTRPVNGGVFPMPGNK